MSSSNTTPNLGLNQWAAEDTPAMEDFNRDNETLDREIQQRTIRVLGEVTLFADRWAQAGEVYRQPLALSVGGGYRVELTCDIPELLMVEGHIVAVNDNGAIYVETNTPSAGDIVAQASAVYVEEMTE